MPAGAPWISPSLAACLPQHGLTGRLAILPTFHEHIIGAASWDLRSGTDTCSLPVAVVAGTWTSLFLLLVWRRIMPDQVE